MDISTLCRLHARYAMPVLTPLGNDTILRAAIPGIDARAGDWDDVLEGGGISTRLLQLNGISNQLFSGLCFTALDNIATQAMYRLWQ